MIFQTRSMTAKCAVVVAALLLWSSATAFAQNSADDTDENAEINANAVEVGEFDDPADPNSKPKAAAAITNPGGGLPPVPTRPRVPSYHSRNMGGHFVLERLRFTTTDGRKIFFWGARIVSLEPQSPLNALDLRERDVVTRFDDVSVFQDSFSTPNGITQLPDLENHHGVTDVRYIYTGRRNVCEGQIDLDRRHSGGIMPIRP